MKPGQWLAVIGCGGLGQLATQYAKAMGFKVVGLDINDEILAMATKAGADATFNSRSDRDGYAAKLKELTGGGGVHAAAVFSNAEAAYNSAPSILRLGGLIMVIGITDQPIPVSTMDMALGKFRVRAESTSIPQRMPKAIDFTAKHNIVPEVEFRSLEDVPSMIDDMETGKSKTRMAVVF